MKNSKAVRDHRQRVGHSLQKRAWLTVLTRLLLLTAFLLAVLIMLALVTLLPFALRQLGKVEGLDWSELSDIGETYGAAAALLAALSLGGVAVSATLQAKEARRSRKQAARTFHFDLVRMELAEPDLLWAAGWPRPELGSQAEQTTDRIRQHLYANMWTYHWLMSYEIGDLGEENLRDLLANELFNGEVGRQYWASTGDTFSVIKGRAPRRFFQIVEDEYRKAIVSGRTPVPASGPSVSPTPDVTGAAAPTGRSSTARRDRAVVLLAGTAGFVAGLVLSRQGPRRARGDHT